MTVDRARRLLLFPALLMAALAIRCGSGSPAPPAPSPGPPPPPQAPIPEIAGTWTGTLEGAGGPARTVTMTIVQATYCIDGAWKDSTGKWRGALSGVATPESFSGQISFEFHSSDGTTPCALVTDAQGPMATDELRWSLKDFTLDDSCTRDMPRSAVLSLRRTQ